jgi:hypothetical protein
VFEPVLELGRGLDDVIIAIHSLVKCAQSFSPCTSLL